VLGVGAALIAMAAVRGVRADVSFIDLDECSATCIPSATYDAAVAEDASADDTAVSLFGGGTEDANNVRPDLILDPRALPRFWSADCRPQSRPPALRPSTVPASRLMPFLRTSSTFRFL